MTRAAVTDELLQASVGKARILGCGGGEARGPVTIIGLPLVIRWMLDESGETRTAWWPVLLLAVFGVMAVHHYAKGPRPRYNKRIGDAQWIPAFAVAAKTGSVPEEPEGRITVGVVACRSIEGLVEGVATVVAVALSALAAPGFPWEAALLPAVVVTVISGFRARRGWAYLRALHTAGPTG